MRKIDSTSVIGPQVQLADDVEIGPGCRLDGPMSLGPGNVLMGYNFLRGPLTVGAGNRFYPFTCIGFEPQDYKYDPSRPGAGTAIGERNIFREHVTIHRATSDHTPTRIGDANMFMVGSHAGHDACVGNHCILANNALVGGHGVLYDRVNLGGGSAVAQKVAVGRLAFVSGTVGAASHVPPFMMSRSRRTVGGINIVGLRRSGMSREEIDHAKWAFRVVYLSRNSRPVVLETLEIRAAESETVREMIAFLRRHPEPICELEGGKASRAMVEAGEAE
ncbi:MAG: acyl-ACP--UDP-N-acetylglucosamine O-acyltransferase [Phycisphaerales bacterium]|nr:acyl-ACP--UDP-N-acetylglucosamine O-acyltransferase [Phycisphaerales bacterium]